MVYNRFFEVCPAFEKFMMQFEPLKFARIHAAGFTCSRESLYATMHNTGIFNDPLEVALTQPLSTWTFATEEDFELIYEATKNNGQDIVNHYAFTRLALRRYSASQGRTWIRQEMSNNSLFGLIHAAKNLSELGLPSEHIETYTKLKDVLFIAHEEYLAKFFEDPKLYINEEVLAKAISIVSSDLEKALPHIERICGRDLFIDRFRQSPLVCALHRRANIKSLTDQVKALTEMYTEVLIHILNCLSYGDVDYVPLEDTTVPLRTNRFANFLKQLRPNMTQEKWQQVEKVCQWLHISLE